MRWGSLAIGAFAFALCSANFSALIPQGALVGLHATRLEGGNLNLLRQEVAMLRADLGQAARTGALLNNRLALVEDSRVGTARRIGALEASVPMLLEALPWDADIDYSLLTAGIGDAEQAEAEGGTVSISRTPMFGPGAPVAEDQPMPAPVVEAFPDGTFGIALGAAILPETAPSVWLDIRSNVGTLLLGLRPLLAPDDNGDGARRLVAGPLTRYEDAQQLCTAITARDVACQPTGFAGSPIDAP